MLWLDATHLDNLPHWVGDMGKSGGWMIGQTLEVGHIGGGSCKVWLTSRLGQLKN